MENCAHSGNCVPNLHVKVYPAAEKWDLGEVGAVMVLGSEVGDLRIGLAVTPLELLLLEEGGGVLLVVVLGVFSCGKSRSVFDIPTPSPPGARWTPMA